MLGSADIIAGKIVVQLRHASAASARAALRAMAAAPEAPGDLADRLEAEGRLSAEQAARVRALVVAFERARADAGFLRLVEREAGRIRLEDLGAVLADLHERGWSARLDEALVTAGLLTTERRDDLVAQQRRAMAQDDRKVLERYVAEDFAGVARPLTSGGLEAEDVSLFKLFGKGLLAVAHAQTLLSTRRRPAPPPGLAPPRPAAPGPSLTMDDVKGLRRIADYDVVQLLGAGGMGAVFLGQKEGMGLFCAVKVMLDAAATEVERRRFQREIALGRRVKHDLVMGILDSGETSEGLSYLVVPALVGKELRVLLDRAGDVGLPLATARRCFERVLEGMQAIHDEGIIHRDVKPENIMVLAGDRGDVKIMDFGLARLEGEADPDDEVASFKTVGDEVSGSPPYLAPEAIRRRPIDRRTDIYSLGVLLFQMLTGKLPFESDSPTGYLTQHVAMPPPTLAEVRPDVRWTPAAERLVERMLAKTPDERPSSCREVLAELRSLALVEEAPEPGSDPVAAPTPTPQDPPTRGWASQGLLGRLIGRG